MARRSGLGKGLGALIPTEVPGPVVGAAGGADRRASSRTPASPGSTSTRRPCPRWRRPSRSSACSSPSWSARSAARRRRVRAHRRRAPVAGGPPGRPADHPGPGPDRRTRPTASSRRWSRTSTGRTSTSSRRRPPTNSSSRSSATPTSRWPPGSGKSRTAVTNTLRLLQLPAGVQRLLAEGQISAGHARALLGHPGPRLPGGAGQAVVAEGLTVRAVEELVRDHVEQSPDAARTGARPTGCGRRCRGVDDGSGRRRPVPAGPRRLPPPGILELEDLLSSHLNTRVKVDMGAKRGKVVVEFATLEDLERIYKLMVGRHRAGRVSETRYSRRVVIARHNATIGPVRAALSVRDLIPQPRGRASSTTCA